jgi:hypothetical protein
MMSVGLFRAVAAPFGFVASLSQDRGGPSASRKLLVTDLPPEALQEACDSLDIGAPSSGAAAAEALALALFPDDENGDEYYA